MSLMKQAQSTDKKSASRRRNGRQSRGAKTAEGKERIRAANLKHGYYSKVREEALVSLGEDPKDLAALIAGALPPPHPEAMSDSEWEETNDHYDEGEESDPPYPEIVTLEGAEREPLRCDLGLLLNCEINETNATWDKIIAEAEAPLSGLERDRLALEVYNENPVMRREESTCFREFWRLGTILSKLRAEGNQEAEDRSQESGDRSRRPEEGVGRQESEVASPMSAVGSLKSEIESSSEVVSPLSEPATPGAALPSDSELRTSNSSLPPSDSGPRTSDTAIPAPDSSLLASELKNEGDSEDVDENKEPEKQVLGVSGQVSELTPNGFGTEGAPDSAPPTVLAPQRAA